MSLALLAPPTCAAATAAALGAGPPLQPAAASGPLELLAPGNGTAASERPCLDGRIVPQLFLLGHQKCGTTSAAELMLTWGAQSASPNKCDAKEIHYFNYACEEDCTHGVSGLHPWGHRSKKWHTSLGFALSYATCDAYAHCRNGDSAAWDMTPDYSPLPGLASALSARLAHIGKQHFSFYVLLRDGLGRMSSAYYMYVHPLMPPLLFNRRHRLLTRPDVRPTGTKKDISATIPSRRLRSRPSINFPTTRRRSSTRRKMPKSL